MVFCKVKTAPKINAILRKLQNFGKEKPKKNTVKPDKLKRRSLKDNDLDRMNVKGEDEQFPLNNNDNIQEDDKGINVSSNYSKYLEGDIANDMNYLDNVKIEDILNDNTDKKNNGRESVKKDTKEDMKNNEEINNNINNSNNKNRFDICRVENINSENYFGGNVNRNLSNKFIVFFGIL